jgi:hypothetical protein
VLWVPQGKGLTLEVKPVSTERCYTGATPEVTVDAIGDPATALTKNLTPCNEFESASLWNEAFRWIEECRQNHERCNSNNVNISEGHPYRILDLSSTQQGYIRLIEMKSPYPCYMALTYLLGRHAGLWPFHLEPRCVPSKDFCGLPREDHPRCSDRLSPTRVSFPVGGLSVHCPGFR